MLYRIVVEANGSKDVVAVVNNQALAYEAERAIAVCGFRPDGEWHKVFVDVDGEDIMVANVMGLSQAEEVTMAFCEMDADHRYSMELVIPAVRSWRSWERCSMTYIEAIEVELAL